jgi:UDP-glucose 4-epimerase
VFTSSAAVYGENMKTPADEESPTTPSSPYGASKLCAETYMILYSKLYDLPVTVLRFSNLYGPRQRKYVVYDILLKLMKNPKKLEILGTGREERDFIYVNDAITALLLASNSPTLNERVFNIGTGISTSISQIVETTLKILQVQPEVSFTKASWQGDIKKLVSNTSRIAKLGFKPKYSMHDGIKETIEWFKSTHT